MKTRLAEVSLALAIAAAVFVLVFPLYSSFDGRRATLLEVDRATVVIPVMFPIVVALLPVVFRIRAVRVVAAFVLGAFALLGGMSIGLFYVPAALMMVAAACVADTPSGSATRDRPVANR